MRTSERESCAVLIRHFQSLSEYNGITNPFIELHKHNKRLQALLRTVVCGNVCKIGKMMTNVQCCIWKA